MCLVWGVCVSMYILFGIWTSWICLLMLCTIEKLTPLYLVTFYCPILSGMSVTHVRLSDTVSQIPGALFSFFPLIFYLFFSLLDNCYLYATGSLILSSVISILIFQGSAETWQSFYTEFGATFCWLFFLGDSPSHFGLLPSGS